MGEVNNFLQNEIRPVVNKFLKKIPGKEIQVISHFDTDGITSGTIILHALKRLDQKFSLKIVKSLNPEFIQSLPKDKITLFVDLASGSINHIKEAGIKEVFIIDHHEITNKNLPENINMINPQLSSKQQISSSGLAYLFAKEIDSENKDLAKLAILGMIGDNLEKEIDTLNNGILEEGEIQRKRGILIYPSTRPLNRVLEYSSNPYIPGVTGEIKGVLDLLREAGLSPENGKYKSIIELDENEMEKLATAILLRNPKIKNTELIGDLFLLKMFNKLEDARDLSAIINACSRSGRPEIAVKMCMEIPEAKKQANSTHIKYKQVLISGLKYAKETKEKIEGNGFAIINAKEKIPDTVAGTIASILSNSKIYEEGTIVVTMAYYDDKIKVSGRNVGKQGRNVREVLAKVVNETEGEVGGHQFAAGCIISREKEEKFIELLKKNLEIETIKV
jgi:RecJ-like exonuclease